MLSVFSIVIWVCIAVDNVPDIRIEPSSEIESPTTIQDATRERTFFSVPCAHTSFMNEQRDSPLRSSVSRLESISNVRKENSTLYTSGTSIKGDDQHKVTIIKPILARRHEFIPRQAIQNSPMTSEERRRNQKWVFLFVFGFFGSVIITVVLVYVEKHHNIF